MTADSTSAWGSTGWRLAAVAAVTLANAGCGFAALAVLAIAPSPLAAWLVFAAWGCDMIDGPLARRLGVASPFGAVLDSLADAVSFGVLPAVLLARAGGRFGWLVGGLYLAAALIRLARFTAAALARGNATRPQQRPRLFIGLPSPAAAMTVAATALLAAGGASPRLLLLAGAAAAAAMVGSGRYVDLVDLVMLRPVFAGLAVVPIGLAVAFGIPAALTAFFAAYIISGLMPARWQPAQ